MTDRITEIFVVDDDDAVRDSLCIMLSTAFPRVSGYSSGKQFLDEFRPRDRNCLVIDIHMPEMTGLEVIERLAETRKRLPAVLLTGRVDSTLRARAIASGVHKLLDKPVDYNELVGAIKAALADPSLH